MIRNADESSYCTKDAFLETACRFIIVLTLIVSCVSTVLAADPTEDTGSPKSLVRPHPQKLFEAFTAYMEGLHKGPSDRRATVRERRREPSASVIKGDEETNRMQQDEALALNRIERREWDLAVPALERAVKAAQLYAQEDKRTRLSRELQNTREKLSSSRPDGSALPGELLNSVGMRMVPIRPGTFVMGSSAAEVARVRGEWTAEEGILRAEQPEHKVRISEAFAMGKYPVTVAQFRQFVKETGYRSVAEKQGWGWVYDENSKHWVKRSGANWQSPGKEVTDDQPVTLVCHLDAEAYCEWLGGREGRRYFLPTEAQWEYAARGGKEGTRFPWGDDYPDGKKLNFADRHAPMPWADRTADDGSAKIAPVGSYEPNNWWLYDMVGNVWQLCRDYYDGKAYEADKSSVVTDPAGPKSGKKRAVRGGNWAFGAGIARNAFRFGIESDLCVDISGFRVATPLSANEIPPSSDRQTDTLNREEVTRLLGRVKDLAESGRRYEARKLIHKLPDPDPQGKPVFDRPGLFVKDVLDALMDVTKDHKLESFKNSLGMTMVRIPSGAFVMGSSETDIAWAMGTLAQGLPISLENEFPFRKVRVTRPFFLGSTPVTVGQFRKFVDDTGYITDAEAEKGGQALNPEDGRFDKKDGTSWKNPGWHVSDDQPVTMVSWDDAQAFVEWLAAKERVPYKLPTEAQWEYACRGGRSLTHFPWGDSPPDARRANFADSSSGLEWRDRNVTDGYKQVAPVGSYEPNGYGLYDMAGNILQWTRDFYGEDYYRYAPEVDPEGPGHGENRVTKGGDWSSPPVSLRCSFRGWSRPDLAFNNTGFRVAIELGVPLIPFYFADDFLTKQWVPDTDHRVVAMAVAKEQERQQKARRPEAGRSQPVAEKTPSHQPTKGVLILGFTQRSDAKRANMAKGDVIVEYNGERDLTSEKFLALTAVTKREKIRPVVVFVREGYEHSARVAPGFLGINVTDTVIQGPIKKREPDYDRSPRDDSDKKSGRLDWS